jgi:EAL domain-containing protein (putative c-di-GMP-specific phosphodiesterase class I)
MMVRTIIQLAQNLHMSVIAEGVEYAPQRDVLLTEGCVLAQGFFFHRPLTVPVLTALLATTNPSCEPH